MNVGDIFLVQDHPCEQNDVVKLLGNPAKYPVYGVITRVQDGLGRARTDVYDVKGKVVTKGWWFLRTEIDIIEESPFHRPEAPRQDIPEQAPAVPRRGAGLHNLFDA